MLPLFRAAYLSDRSSQLSMEIADAAALVEQVAGEKGFSLWKVDTLTTAAKTSMARGKGGVWSTAFDKQVQAWCAEQARTQYAHAANRTIVGRPVRQGWGPGEGWQSPCPTVS